MMNRNSKGQFIKGLRVSQQTEFKKGMTPWNKGLKGRYSVNAGENHPMYGKHHTQEAVKKIGSASAGRRHTEESKAKMRLINKDGGRWNYKGDDVGYMALHQWVYRNLGKAVKCSNCEGKNAKRFEWANKSHEYKRDLQDWVQLCINCHHAYDRGGIQLSNLVLTTKTIIQVA